VGDAGLAAGVELGVLAAGVDDEEESEEEDDDDDDEPAESDDDLEARESLR
jgi:hypothetical protein